MRTAGRIAAESGWLIWNHGGSGDDVEAAHPGHVVSVLTPTSRYAQPFLQRLASEPGGPRDLCIIHGPGSFGRQVADGVETIARQSVNTYCAGQRVDGSQVRSSGGLLARSS